MLAQKYALFFALKNDSKFNQNRALEKEGPGRSFGALWGGVLCASFLQLGEPGLWGGVGEGKTPPQGLGNWGFGICSWALHASRHKASADLHRSLSLWCKHISFLCRSLSTPLEIYVNLHRSLSPWYKNMSFYIDL